MTPQPTEPTERTERTEPRAAKKRLIPQRTLAFILLVGVATAFGLTFSFNRYVADEHIPFIAYVFWQTVSGAVVLLAVSLLARRPPTLKPRNIRGYLALGFFGFALPYCILAAVAPKVPAGVVSLGPSLAPILTYIFAMALRMERFAWLRTLGILCGFAGVLLVLVPTTSLPSADMLPWVLVAFTVPISFACAAIVGARFRPPDDSSLTFAAGTLIAAALLMVPVAAATDSWWFFSGPMTIGDWAVIGTSLINMIFAVLMLEIIRMAGPVFFSSGNFVVTLAGVLWAMWLFGESHSAWIWAALGLMFVGLFLVNRSGGGAAKETA